MLSSVDLSKTLAGTKFRQRNFLSDWRALTPPPAKTTIDGIKIVGFNGSPVRDDNPFAGIFQPIGLWDRSGFYHVLRPSGQSLQATIQPGETIDQIREFQSECQLTLLDEEQTSQAFYGAAVFSFNKSLINELGITEDELQDLSTKGLQLLKLDKDTWIAIGHYTSIADLTDAWGNILIHKVIDKLKDYFKGSKSDTSKADEAMLTVGYAFSCSRSAELRAYCYLLDVLAIKHSDPNSDKDERINKIFELLVQNEFPHWTRKQFDAGIDELEKALLN